MMKSMMSSFRKGVGQGQYGTTKKILKYLRELAIFNGLTRTEHEQYLKGFRDEPAESTETISNHYRDNIDEYEIVYSAFFNAFEKAINYSAYASDKDNDAVKIAIAKAIHAKAVQAKLVTIIQAERSFSEVNSQSLDLARAVISYNTKVWNTDLFVGTIKDALTTKYPHLLQDVTEVKAAAPARPAAPPSSPLASGAESPHAASVSASLPPPTGSAVAAVPAIAKGAHASLGDDNQAWKQPAAGQRKLSDTFKPASAMTSPPAKTSAVVDTPAPTAATSVDLAHIVPG